LDKVEIAIEEGMKDKAQEFVERGGQLYEKV
jgi:hypothetical protein